MTAPKADQWHTDHTTARFQEWIAAHPKPVLTDHEQADDGSDDD
jgi:hypothetical protein